MSIAEPMPQNPWITKDSGSRQVFESGAQRDTQDGKLRFDLVPLTGLERLAGLYTRGADKYDDHNWKKGIPYSRCYASMVRHLFQWAIGDRDEDHLAAVAWNAFALMHYEDTGRTELDDMDETVRR